MNLGPSKSEVNNDSSNRSEWAITCLGRWHSVRHQMMPRCHVESKGKRERTVKRGEQGLQLRSPPCPPPSPSLPSLPAINNSFAGTGRGVWVVEASTQTEAALQNHIKIAKWPPVQPRLPLKTSDKNMKRRGSLPKRKWSQHRR